MNGLVFIGLTMLIAIGGAVVFALLSTPEEEHVEKLHPFAVLPVTDSTPSARALLQHYASQITWMDAEVLQCVLLVYLPEDAAAETLCRDMARDHEVFTAVPLPEVYSLLEEQCRQNVEIL